MNKPLCSLAGLETQNLITTPGAIMNDNNLQHITVKNDLSFSMAKALLYSLIFIIPLVVLLVNIYFIVWGEPHVVIENTILFILKLILVAFLGVVLHELIHGLSWVYFSKKTFDTIKFGFQWKTLTPYAHSTEPMEVTAYRLGAMMPGLLMGVFPYLLGIITGNVWIMFFGSFFTLSAIGDALVLWSIRKIKSGQLVEDHSTRCGCYVIEPQNN
ncbi:MAG: DUF3267 domain-containing protein [Chloroflexota bacterium]|nr:DUF3267 domain-containing protein [Chloroflexota bacterium]